MINISFDTWYKTCVMVREYSKKYGKFYIQLYPLNCSLDYFTTKEFYETYIKTGLIFTDSKNFDRMDNYCLKQNGSFRNRYLITPIMYLYYIAIGLHISEKYKSNRNSEIIINYGGDFKKGDLHYRNSYNNFVKAIINDVYEYNYFYKLDISDFFNKLDINHLNKKISNSMKFSQKEQMFLKEFLIFCGNGSFPQTECGTTSSYLATEIYFETIDNKLYNFLNKDEDIKKFKIFRYVDDLYILLDIDGRKNMDKIENRISAFYQNELYSHNLSINKIKSIFEKTDNIFCYLKSFSIFDDPYNDIEISDDYKQYLINFLSELCSISDNKSITYQKYEELLSKHFESGEDAFHASQLLYVLVYKNTSWLKNSRVIKKLKHIIKNDFNILTLDPRKIVAMIVNTHDEELINTFLNNLYIVAEKGKWNISYNYVAIEYLLYRNFVSTKLLNKMEVYYPSEVAFLKEYLKNDWRKKYKNDYLSNYINKINILKSPAITLKFLETTALLKKDYLLAQSYNKSYFDSITKHFEIKFDPNCDKDKIFYKKEELKAIYTNFINVSDVEWEKIDKLCNTRNGNPLCHASLTIFNSKNDINKKIVEDIVTINEFLDSILDRI